MSTFRLLCASLMLSVACNPEPACDELYLSPLEADVSSGEPVFRWKGDAASLEVSVEEELSWSIRCNCIDEERNPDRNTGCSHTEREYEFRHCLTGPIQYGETPDVDTLIEPGDYDETIEQLEPLPLISGKTYEASISAFCSNGRDGEGRRFMTRRASFEAP